MTYLMTRSCKILHSAGVTCHGGITAASRLCEINVRINLAMVKEIVRSHLRLSLALKQPNIRDKTTAEKHCIIHVSLKKNTTFYGYSKVIKSNIPLSAD